MSSQTIPITVTTTGYELELVHETQVIEFTSTEYQAATVVQTVQGIPVTQVVTQMQTKRVPLCGSLELDLC